MARLSILLAGATALLATFAASADSYVMVHPGSECTETPHIAGGMYGSTATGQDHIGYWNDGASGTIATVFCPVGSLGKLHLEEYDWDSETRISSEPIRSMTAVFPQGSPARLRVWLTANNSGPRRDRCWVDVTYPVASGAFFDSESTEVVYLQAGFNVLQFDLTGMLSSHAYATLVCKVSGVDADTGLPSQIAGYTLEVVE